MVHRKTANIAALVTAAVVLLVGLGLWLKIGPSFDGPEKTTTVVEVTKGEGRGKTTHSFEVTSKPGGTGGDGAGSAAGRESKSTDSVERPFGGLAGKKSTTTEEGSRSFAERVLGESGLALLQVAVILLAAFLAAAFVQRVLIGDYALKIGPIDIGAAQEGKEEALIKLGAELADNIKALKKEEVALAKLSRKYEGTAKKTAGILNSLAALDMRLATLEGKKGGAAPDGTKGADGE
jgi:hypothetical protein